MWPPPQQETSKADAYLGGVVASGDGGRTPEHATEPEPGRSVPAAVRRAMAGAQLSSISPPPDLYRHTELIRKLTPDQRRPSSSSWLGLFIIAALFISNGGGGGVVCVLFRM